MAGSSQAAFPSFSRALSPATIGVAVASSGADPLDGVSSRLNALALAKSLDEVIATVPLSYRETLRGPLKDLVQLVEKSTSVRVSLMKLVQHRTTGTWPPQLAGMKVPAFQVTGAYAVTQPPILATMASDFAAFRVDTLNNAVDLKQAELEHLEELLAQKTYLPDLRKAAAEKWQEIAAQHLRPKWKADGTLDADGWTEDPVLKRQFTRLVDDLPQIAFYAIQTARSQAEVEVEKKKRKIERAHEDIIMGDATLVTSASITEMVNKAVEQALTPAKKGKKVMFLHSTL